MVTFRTVNMRAKVFIPFKMDANTKAPGRMAGKTALATSYLKMAGSVRASGQMELESNGSIHFQKTNTFFHKNDLEPLN